MSSDPVEAYFEDALAALAALGQHEPSLSVALRASFSKGLLLAAASAFESRLASHLESLYRQRLPDRPDLVAFVVSAGIKRRYHTYFSWDSSNANQFFGLFGPDRATQLKNQFGAESGVREFMRIGRLRNELVHGDFAAFPLEDTLEDLIERYRRGRSFMDALHNALA